MSKFGLKKLFKGVILVGLVYLAFQYAASSQNVLDVGESKGDSKVAFQEKIINFTKNLPEIVLEYLHLDWEENKEIPDEVMIVFYDLENKLKDQTISTDQKSSMWRMNKAKEIADKYGLENSQVWELYVRVKKEQENNNI